MMQLKNYIEHWLQKFLNLDRRSQILLGCTIGLVFCGTLHTWDGGNAAPENRDRSRNVGSPARREKTSKYHHKGVNCRTYYDDSIGKTPLIRLNHLSESLGCDILAKMESKNPGGTGKDRAAKYMLLEHLLSSTNSKSIDESPIVEGTSGNTGISLAHLCKELGLDLHIVMPDDQSNEKKDRLEELGAHVKVVPNASISNAHHYVNAARTLAQTLEGTHLDQFENLANTHAHYSTTGPEIWKACEGHLDVFVMSAGTGGTISGVSQYLNEQKDQQRLEGEDEYASRRLEVVLADPQGSSLFHRVRDGVCFTIEQRERKQKKHRYDTIVEGVGLDRVTANFENAQIDSAERISDQEVVDTAHWLLEHEGLFVSSSSALNIAASVRVAKRLGPGHRIVTIICESGQRHYSRFYNPEYLAECGLQWPDESDSEDD